MGRGRSLALLTGLGALASACAGDPAALNGLSSGVSTESIASGSAFPDAATGPAAASGVGNPLAPPDGAATGGREVIASPTVADIMLTGTLPEMALGRPEAPVVIVQYASLTCPHCRAFHRDVFPELKRAYIDTGKVRYILREFPIGKSSGNATIALRCAKPAKYFDLYGKFMQQQASWVSQEVRLDAIFAVASEVGMTRGQFDACLKNQGMIDALKWVKERGRKLGIVGTPNFFVDGKLVKSTLSMAELRTMIEARLDAPATVAGGSGAQ